jgi:glycosyltransferase involved in cell wall biosynthesis
VSAAPINSREWWEAYFRSTWVPNNGPAQTEYFMGALLEHLPAAEAAFLAEEGRTILDWGCALGQGVARLAAAFPRAHVAGVDFSSEAIETARRQYPHLEFVHEPEGRVPRDFDVLVTSNCLEHFASPLDVVAAHLERVDYLYLALVPYDERQRIEAHAVRLREDSFPQQFGGFARIHTSVFRTDAAHWAGRQMLVIYASPTYVQLGGSARLARAVPLPLPRGQNARTPLPHGQLADADALALRESVEQCRARALQAEHEAASSGERARELREWTQTLEGSLARQQAEAEARRLQAAEDSSALHAWVAKLTSDLAQKAATERKLWEEYQALDARHAADAAEHARQHEAMRARLVEAEARVADLAAETARLSSESATQRRHLREKSAEADAIWRRLTRVEAEAERQASELAQRSADAAHLGRRTRDLDAELQGIYQSTGWRVLKVLYAVRFFLFPQGSRRERLARRFMQWRRARRLRRSWPPAPAAAAPGDAAGNGRISGEESPVVRACGTAPGLVSIVLPVYNQAHLLAEAIDSVLAQTYEHFELIVVNDGSSDGVEDVLARYAGHPRVRLLTQSNQKLPKALSNGFDLARGEFWTWTSADNLMEPRQLERQVAFLRDHGEAAMVYCDYTVIDDRGEPLQDPTFRPHNRRSPESPEIHLPRTTEGLNSRDDNFIGPCFLYRAWVGRLIGEYAPRMGIEDYDYWMRINGLFTVRHLGSDEVLYRYRVHDRTLSAEAAQHRIAERVRELMETERRRAESRRLPWTILADEPTRVRLARTDCGPHTVAALEDQPGSPDRRDDVKEMILVRADALRDWTGEPSAVRPSGALGCTVAWFDDDPRLPYELAARLRDDIDLCLAGDAATLDRLGIFTQRALALPPGRALLDVATAFGDNHRFYSRSVPAEDRARRLARPWSPGDRRTRVLIQVEHFLQGGFEQVVLDLVSVLDPHSFEVAIVAFGREGPAAERARALGLRFERLPAGDREASYRRLLRDLRPDVINAHYAPFGAHVARELGIPFLQTIHSAYVWLDDEQRAAQRAAEPFTDAYLCVSAAAAAYADLRLGIPPRKMMIAPNGIDTAALEEARAAVRRDEERSRLGLLPDDFVFLHVASIYPPKGHHLLIEALAQVRRAVPRARVALLGQVMDEPYAERLRQRVRELGLEDAVLELGYHVDPQRFYFLSDGFVLPSFVEGWSLALAEALHAGLPAIATDVGAARDLLTRAGGELLQPPFESLVNLDAPRLYQLLAQEHPDFVERLAASMRRVAGGAARSTVDAVLRRSLDREHAYELYADLFAWTALGGDALAARGWAWEGTAAGGAAGRRSPAMRPRATQLAG